MEEVVVMGDLAPNETETSLNFSGKI